ncbi:MAG: hypothetical protein RBT63_04135, partial [Bdellovibrionales bacterium]|nr:hypothetical protein [Bdellovibrionales bacterium]
TLMKSAQSISSLSATVHCEDNTWFFILIEMEELPSQRGEVQGVLSIRDLQKRIILQTYIKVSR